MSVILLVEPTKVFSVRYSKFPLCCDSVIILYSIGCYAKNIFLLFKNSLRNPHAYTTDHPDNYVVNMYSSWNLDVAKPLFPLKFSRYTYIKTQSVLNGRFF